MSHNSTVVNVRITPKMKAELVERAAKDNRKLSDYVRLLIAAHLQKP
jgi:predicted HicB family RNase H-like nuclease